MNKHHSEKNILKRTVKLENELATKMCELEIEAALEKVRVVVMRMRKPVDLSDIAKIIFKELKKLGFADLRNTEIIINNDEKETILSYYCDYGVSGTIEVDYKINPVLKKWAEQLKKSKNAFVEVNIPEKEMKQWRKFREQIGYQPDPKLNKAKTVYYYSHSIGLGAVSISSFTAVSKEQIKILKRFRNVFQLSYHRYIDIAKAEAQTREAQIQLALEKVRARTMEMQKSDELRETSLVLFEQLKALGEPAEQLSIAVIKEDEDVVEVSATVQGKKLPQIFRHRIDEPVVMKKIVSGWKVGGQSLVIDISGKKLEQYNRYRNELTNSNMFPVNITNERRLLYAAFYSRGVLALAASKPRPKESLQLLERFAKVFDGTFTRFLDLKKAEAQAREAIIEAALERVRYRAMAMQTSKDVGEATSTMFVELDSLGIETFRCGIAIVSGDEMEVWSMGNTGDGRTVKGVGRISFHLHPLWIYYVNEWRKKTEVSYYYLVGKEKEYYVRILTSMPTYNLSDINLHFPDLHFQGYYFEEGSIFTFSLHPHSEADKQVMKRFANVFALTFRRYRDLQKAEAQARESQIELALERVRAKTMAMHKSSELLGVINVLADQFQILGFKIHSANFNTSYREKDWHLWLYNPGAPIYPEQIHIPYFDHPYFNRTLEALANGSDFNAFVFTKEEKDSFLDHLFKHTIARNAPEERKKFSYAAPGFAWSAVYLKSTALTIANYDAEPYTEEQNAIIRRFGNVFEQSYTRFLDLQKAEAQAREAQIEAALEKVRARTMGMQRSEELSETAYVLFQQLVILGEDPIQITIGIMNEEQRSMEFRVTDWGGGGSKVTIGFDVSIDEPTLISKIYKAWKRNDRSIVIDLTGQELEGWLQYRNSVSGVQVKSTDTRGRRVISVAFFANGLIAFSTPLPRPQESILLLERFAAVFDLTYTRFLDLKKAESQAREAQIEASLERVRSKTMAMHNSNDVGETVAAMFAEFMHLGIHTNRCGILIFDNEYTAEVWTARSTLEGHAKLIVGKLDLDAHKLLRSVYNAWKAKEIFYQYDLLDNDLTRYYTAINNSKFYPTQFDLNALPSKEFHSDFFFTDGAVFSFTNEPVADEHAKIMKRFAALFGQTYRRYLDLQKAEAQAREAQIETALERVRSRSLAMHHTSEIQAVIHSVHEELLKLSISIVGGSFIVINKDIDTDLRVWGSGGTADTITETLVPGFGMPFCTNLVNGIKKGAGFFTEEFSREQKIEYFTELFRHEPWSNIADEEKEKILESEGAYTRSVCVSKHTTIFIINHNGRKFTEDENEILRRFSKVFDQSYTRFLDLQKAEAQARESQIQLALERVRARSMAMHHSSELHAVADVLFQQLRGFGGNIMNAGIALCKQDADEDEYWLSSDDGLRPVISIPHTEDPIQKKLYEDWKNKSEFFSIAKEGDELKAHYNYMQSVPSLKPFFEEGPDWSFPTWQKWHAAYFSHGYLFMITLEPYEQEKILVRFASVFEQAYTRFLDLQKAEASAREAQIEAALERVRGKVMAMHTSQDLGETIRSFYQQMRWLGLTPKRCGVGTIDDEERVSNLTSMYTTDDGESVAVEGKLLLKGHPMLEGVYQHFLAQKEYYPTLRGNKIKEYYKLINPQISYSDMPHGAIQYGYFFFFPEGGVYAWTENKMSENELSIYRRFTSVLSLTYKRYLDLQKAEAQAREAQIEAGLERVRARTMAMHTSDDVGIATATMFTELERLGIENFRGGINNILRNRTQEVWSVNNLAEGKVVKAVGAFNIDAHPFWQLMFKEWEEKKDFLHYLLAGQEKEDYIKILNATRGYLTQTIEKFPDVHFQVYYFNEGSVWTNSLHPHSEEDRQIMKRFASVFSLTFRRYQDLKKAEAQAREATIEAALERVRAKAMAMHTSQDLTDTIGVFYKELHSFSLIPVRCGVGLLDKEERVGELFTWNTTEQGKSLELVGRLKMEGHPVLNGVYEHWVSQQEYHPVLRGNEIKDYYKILRPQIAFPEYSHDVVLYGYFFFFKEGGVYAWTEREMQEDELNIYRRFTSVLSLTYKRYKDLQYAEAQTREAQIEAALERVRAKAMAMQNSNDLSIAASMVFIELRKLGINPIRCGVGLLNKESRKAQLYSAASSENGHSLSLVGWVQLEDHPVLEKIYDAWLNNEDYFPELQGRQLQSYYELLLAGLSVSVPDFSNEQKQFGHFISFPVGCLYAWSDACYNEDQIKIFKRFATIVDLTFRRYLELQQSEANAREAVKQAALDRIRADIASMRKVEDLDRITPLIWNELTILGIPFIRCGVFIMDDSQQLIHTFLSTPDGKAIAAFHLPYTTPGNIQKVIGHWREEKNYIDHWDESDFTQFAEILVGQNALASAEVYLKTIPHDGFYLHFLPFLQGMLYVGNTEQLNDDEIKLIQSVAEAFSTAYARYEDFNKLEAAKQQVEKTLVHLKQAQTQLVQSEKMASLGELTAGIAHEIQNPLNFVNNFSDVSNELLDEMKEELANGNINEAMAIAEDVKHNLEKINHHGKRADGIVKGMLQHSRTNTGQTELTDINSLVDEYLRLAYHGLRAKDKSFNAKFETDFDNGVSKINIIPQDIGRVILNLINNAFYAVTEKKKQSGPDYEPTVIVTTRSIQPSLGGRSVQIKVADNGSGIPKKIIDKIFQPFFTTKPTGQGTGLGLSLAYDIIKAHGGEVKVETKESEGSEFVIHLPSKNHNE